MKSQAAHKFTRILFALSLLIPLASSAHSADPERKLVLVVSRRSSMTDLSSDELKKVLLGEPVLTGREVWIAAPPANQGDLTALAKEFLGLTEGQFEAERAGRSKAAANGLRYFETTPQLLSAVRAFPNVVGVARLKLSEVDDSLVVVWKSSRN